MKRVEIWWPQAPSICFASGARHKFIDIGSSGQAWRSDGSFPHVVAPLVGSEDVDEAAR